MVIHGEELKVKKAEKQFIELYRIFTKFISNDPSIQMLNGEPFDMNKVDAIHELQIVEYNKNDDLFEDAFDELEGIKEELNRYLELKKHGYTGINPSYINYLVGRYNSLKLLLDGKNDISFFDYYFKYKDRYYAIDMGSDLDSFGLCIPNESNNLMCCELREFNEYIECEDTKRSICFIYDKEKEKVDDIISVTKYGLDPYGYRYYRDNQRLNASKVNKHL